MAPPLRVDTADDGGSGGTSLALLAEAPAGTNFVVIIGTFQLASQTTATATWSATVDGNDAPEAVSGWGDNASRNYPSFVIFTKRTSDTSEIEYEISSSISMVALTISVAYFADIDGSTDIDAISDAVSSGQLFSNSSDSFDIDTPTGDSTAIGGWTIQGGDQAFTPGTNYTEEADFDSGAGAGNSEHDVFLQSRSFSGSSTVAFDGSWTTADGGSGAAIVLQEAAAGTTVAIGEATEADTAEPIEASKAVTVGEATETDTAVSITTPASSTPDIEIQRGVVVVPLAGTTSSPTTDFGSLTSAFVLNSNSRRTHAGPDDEDSGNQEGDDMSGAIELTAVDTLTFSREPGSTDEDMRFAWESWEYVGPSGGDNEFIVRGRAEITLDGVSTNTATISGITNINNCVPFITGIRTDSTADDGDSLTGIAWLSGTDTLNVKRGGTDNTVVVYVTVVEFTGSNWQIAHGRLEGDTTDSGTITLVDDADGETAGGGDISDWGTALIHHQYCGNQQNGVDDSLSDNAPIYEPAVATTQVDYTFDSNHADSGAIGSREEHFVRAIRHPDMVVTRFSNTSSVSGANNIDITTAGLTDIAHAVCENTRTVSGTGTAYGRGWCNSRLTSTTNLELWTHRSGNTIESQIQVADLASIVSSSAAPIEVDAGAASETDAATSIDPAKAVEVGTAAETDAAVALSSDQTIAVGEASETDSAPAVEITREVTTGTAAESDSAVAIEPEASIEAGAASETDTASAIDITKEVDVGTAAEADTADSLSSEQSIVVGEATEADITSAIEITREVPTGTASETSSAETVTPEKVVEAGTATESDTAPPADISRQAQIGTAAETDSPVGIDGAKSIDVGSAGETDAAGSVQARREVQTGTAEETDSAIGISSAGDTSVGTATETDSGGQVEISKIVDTGQATESDAATEIEPGRQLPTGTAAEADAAQPADITRVVETAPSAETDIAGPIGTSGGGVVDTAIEDDAARAITPEKIVDVGSAAESDEAEPAGPGRALPMGTADEADSGVAIDPSREVSAGTAAEGDAAPSIEASRQVDLGTAAESDTAAPIDTSDAKAIGTATEDDAALAITPEKSVSVDPSIEADEARPIEPGRAFPAGTAEETDAAGGAAFARGVEVGIAAEADAAEGVEITRTVDVGTATEADQAGEIESSVPDASIFLTGEAGDTESLTGDANQTATLSGSARKTISLQGSAS